MPDRRFAMRRIVFMLLTLGLTLLTLTVADPAAAIIGGTDDGARHPFGACIVSRQPDGSLSDCSSGALIAPTVVVMAGHSAFNRNALGSEHYVTFDPVVDRTASELIPATLIPHPAYGQGGPDVGVAILSRPITGISPVELPTAGLIDRLRASGTLAHADLTMVGYGCGGPDVEVLIGNHPLLDCYEDVWLTRRWATALFAGTEPGWLQLQTTEAATGSGSPCFGDSGGPVMLDDSNVALGIVISVTRRCTGVTWATALDAPAVRVFLGRFVQLP
jgi:Trypsin